MRRPALPALAILALALSGCTSQPLRPDTGQASVATRPPTSTQAPAATLPAANDVKAEAAAVQDIPAAIAPQHGLASWYGRRFQSRRTASGERFDMHALTAAHLKLPLGSYARVTLLSSGKSVVVRITDRGPHVAQRVIDVSRDAAAQLGLLKRGVGEVLVEQIASAG